LKEYGGGVSGNKTKPETLKRKMDDRIAKRDKPDSCCFSESLFKVSPIKLVPFEPPKESVAISSSSPKPSTSSVKPDDPISPFQKHLVNGKWNSESTKSLIRDFDK